MNILSTLTDVLMKGTVSLPTNKAFSVDALLKAANVELYKTESGVIDSRLKKAKSNKDNKDNKNEEAELLVPVDVAAKPEPDTNLLKPHQDAYSGHPSRLAVLDRTLCMARKIDDNDVIAGTNIGDAGANGKFYGEKQCARKPKEGNLCAICTKKDREAKADPTKAINGWYGRLDEELYWKAFVIGCKHFFVRYPNGIAGDPTTAPIAPITENEMREAPLPSESQKTKKTPQKRIKKTVVIEEPKESIASEEPKESIAIDVEVKECEWKTMFHNGMALIRNLKNGNVYQANSDFSTREEMVMKDKFEGRWVNGELDPYAEEIHDE